MSPCRLAIVISHPIQHFAPVYAQLARSGAVELKVFFIAENGLQNYHDQEFGTQVKWDVPLTKGYPHEFVEPGKVIDDFSFFNVDSKQLVEKVNQFAPHFIWLNGYAYRANWRVLLARPKNAQVIYGSDSNLSDPRSWLRTALKRHVIKWFFKRCDFFLSISPSNRQYLLHYGAKSEQIADTTYPVDISRFKQQKALLSESDSLALKESLKIPDTAMVILYAGKLIPHKRPQDIIQAMAHEGVNNCHVVMVGSGSMQSELEMLAQRKGISDRCHFVGFVNQSEMANYFSIADLLVFPSEREPYGAIVAETLPFGIPIIAAENIGAVGSSVFEGENALLYPCGDIQALVDAIECLIYDPERRINFSRASIALADRHDKSNMAGVVTELCKQDIR